MLFFQFSTFVHRPSKKQPRKKIGLLGEGRVTSLKIHLSVDFWGYGIPLMSANLKCMVAGAVPVVEAAGAGP